MTDRRTRPDIEPPGLDAAEGESWWQRQARTDARVTTLEGKVRALWAELRRTQKHCGAPDSDPPPDVLEVSGPKGIRVKGAAWAVVLLAVLATLGVVVWHWGPPVAHPKVQTHGGR